MGGALQFGKLSEVRNPLLWNLKVFIWNICINPTYSKTLCTGQRSREKHCFYGGGICLYVSIPGLSTEGQDTRVWSPDTLRIAGTFPSVVQSSDIKKPYDLKILYLNISLMSCCFFPVLFDFNMTCS